MNRSWLRRGVWVVLLCGMVMPGFAQPEKKAEPKLFIVPIHGPIYDIAADFVDRCLDEAIRVKAEAVVFEMDTPGGLVSSAKVITERIKSLKSMKTIAWVRPEAISAGAMISVACDEIVVAPSAMLGDCAAIMVGPQGPQEMGKTERAKIDSYILAEFRDSAKTNGYPETLSEAMVTLGPAIYRVKRDGETRFVREPDLARYGLNTDGSQREGESIEPGWKFDRKVLDTDRLLTMIADEAMDLGFAKAKIADETELVRYVLGETATTASIQRHETTWSEDLVGWLTSPAVRGVLMLLLMLGAYMELQSPGVGLPGAVALIALIVVLGAPYLAGLADMMEVLLIVIGIGLLAVEMFVLPGFGIAGFCGLLLMGIGFVLTFAENEPGPNVLPLLMGTWRMLATGLITTVIAMAFSIVGFVFLTRYFGSIPLLSRMILEAPVPASGPSVRTADSRVGCTGRVISDLRPSGRMLLDGKHLDVVSRGAVIENGALVRVVEIAGNRIVVEEVEA